MTGNLEDEAAVSYNLRLIRQRIKAVDAAFEAKTKVLSELNSAWASGLIDAGKGAFGKEKQLLEEETGNLLVEKVVLRTSMHKLAGQEVDAEIWSKQSHTADWGYVDLLISRFTEPSGATLTLKAPKREPSRQEGWRKALFQAYDAEHSSGLSWCPITGFWVPTASLTAAHLVRYNVTEPAAVHLFGPANGPDGHIWSLRNGILVSSFYEAMLDDAKIAIVPTKDEKDLMVTVLDPTNQLPGGLHGRVLKFRSDHRPAMRYLYFNFAINILRRQRHEVKGWWRDRLAHIDTRFFATPGKWVEETTLRTLATRIGHLSSDEASDFVGKANEKILKDVDEKVVGNEERGSAEDEEAEDDKREVYTSLIQYAYRDLSAKSTTP
ncbi:hypothetical protein GGS20DRAFT_546685 [Poronia punctata]|nr:hypothetical protein GGS20DRAFT_546685 [Poronia punctata]